MQVVCIGQAQELTVSRLKLGEISKLDATWETGHSGKLAAVVRELDKESEWGLGNQLPRM